MYILISQENSQQCSWLYYFAIDSYKYFADVRISSMQNAHLLIYKQWTQKIFVYRYIYHNIYILVN